VPQRALEVINFNFVIVIEIVIDNKRLQQ